jgi:sugar lactone lactonase YvrE
MRIPPTRITWLAAVLAGCGAGETVASPTAPAADASPEEAYPDVIALPAGFVPEGITFARGTTFYVGSRSTGAIYRGDARADAGDLLVPGLPGHEVRGLAFDHRRDRLFAAGGATGQAYVHDASTGALLAVYQLADPRTGATLVNDVTVLSDAAYYTDAFRPVIYRMPLGPEGELPAAGAVQTIPLSGEFDISGNALLGDANGIAATPDELQLILLSKTTGLLYLVDPRDGVATAIDLGGETVPGGDGILLVGRTLYVAMGSFNQIAVVQLGPGLTRGVLERVIRDPLLQSPSSIARLGNTLYAANARLDVTSGPDGAYQVVRVAMKAR